MTQETAYAVTYLFLQLKKFYFGGLLGDDAQGPCLDEAAHFEPVSLEDTLETEASQYQEWGQRDKVQSGDIYIIHSYVPMETKRL